MRTITINDQTFSEFKFTCKVNKNWTITFGDNLELPDYLYKSLLLGCWEYIGGCTLGNHKQSGLKELTIPRDYGSRGGVFHCYVNFATRTVNVTGYVNAGHQSENDAPFHVFGVDKNGQMVDVDEWRNRVVV